MSNMCELSRMEIIRLGLKRGDKKAIARQLSVHPVWVSYVIGGKGVSERVLRAAEQLIAERQKSQTN